MNLLPTRLFDLSLPEEPPPGGAFIYRIMLSLYLYPGDYSGVQIAGAMAVISPSINT